MMILLMCLSLLKVLLMVVEKFVGLVLDLSLSSHFLLFVVRFLFAKFDHLIVY
jgi:hypothetical protein